MRNLLRPVFRSTSLRENDEIAALFNASFPLIQPKLMKKSAFAFLAAAVICLGSIGCSASAKIDIPRGSIAKPAKDVQLAYVATPVSDSR